MILPYSKNIAVKILRRIWQITEIFQVFLPIFTISITFPMQMDFNLPNFFYQISYNPYLPNFLLPKFFIHNQNIVSAIIKVLCICVHACMRVYVLFLSCNYCICECTCTNIMSQLYAMQLCSITYVTTTYME